MHFWTVIDDIITTTTISMQNILLTEFNTIKIDINYTL